VIVFIGDLMLLELLGSFRHAQVFADYRVALYL
jgi:hypothetical protein